jgi:hypothetical protein
MFGIYGNCSAGAEAFKGGGRKIANATCLFYGLRLGFAERMPVGGVTQQGEILPP